MIKKVSIYLNSQKAFVITIAFIIWSISLAIPLVVNSYYSDLFLRQTLTFGEFPTYEFMRGVMGSVFMTPIFLLISFLLSKLVSIFKIYNSTFLIFSILTISYFLLAVFKFGDEIFQLITLDEETYKIMIDKINAAKNK